MAFIEIGLISFLLIGVLFFASFWIFHFQSSISQIEKFTAYECGFEPINNSRMKYEIVYYVIGLLYLIFDLEIIFLFPLATILYTFDSFFIFMLANIFILIITVGFIYEIFVGALDFS